jgi:glycosyltransferase involved in cell wall biosynthesis
MSGSSVTKMFPVEDQRENKVTVIIPTYNYGHYLPRAIESVLSQTCRNYEILVIDDGSTDDTAAIASEYSLAHPQVHYLFQKNAGLSAARNTGIQAARTPYLVFLDADDELEPRFLERCFATLKTLPDTYALVACSCRSIDANGLIQEGKKTPERASREITQRDLLLKNRFAPVVLVERHAFAAVGLFDTSLRSSEDREMWIRIAATRKLFLLDEPLARKRNHPTNMSRNSDRMRANMRQVLTREFRADQAKLKHCFFWLRVASYFHFQNAWMLHEEGRRAEAVRDATVSLLLWPCFAQPASLGDPPLFRLRALLRFLARPQGKAS